MESREEFYKNISGCLSIAEKLTWSYTWPENVLLSEKDQPIAISFSGWKDSFYTLQHALELWFDVKYLFVMIDPASWYSITWPYNIELIEQLAQAVGIELIKCNVNIENPSQSLKQLCSFFLEKNISTLWFWYYIPEWQREIIQSISYPMGFQLFEPNLWVNQEKRLLQIIKSWIKPIITGINYHNIDKKYLWTILNLDFYKYLKSKESYLDFCWENWDFQTLVYDSSISAEPLLLREFYDFQDDHYIHRFYL